MCASAKVCRERDLAFEITPPPPPVNKTDRQNIVVKTLIVPLFSFQKLSISKYEIICMSSLQHFAFVGVAFFKVVI